jgi:hypothetical protein
VPQLLDKVNALAAENGGSIFQVPPYFPYISKAFCFVVCFVLGIDPNDSNPNPYPDPNPKPKPNPDPDPDPDPNPGIDPNYSNPNPDPSPNPDPDPDPDPNPGIDPNYSIVKETLPYISTRIITDPSPRTGGALATFVYGEAKDDAVSSP